MEVRWTAPALIDLNEAIAYIANDSPKAATSVGVRIAEATQNLARHPGLGRPGRVPNTRELVISGTPYVVPYRVRGDRVEVLRVLHAPEDGRRRSEQPHPTDVNVPCAS